MDGEASFLAVYPPPGVSLMGDAPGAGRFRSRWKGPYALRSRIRALAGLAGRASAAALPFVTRPWDPAAPVRPSVHTFLR